MLFKLLLIIYIDLFESVAVSHQKTFRVAANQYLQRRRRPNVHGGWISLPALETVDMSNTRTGDKQQFSSTLPDLQGQGKMQINTQQIVKEMPATFLTLPTV